jgi:hypothetical protein
MYVILYIRTYISYALNIMSRYQFILVEGHWKLTNLLST